MKNQKVEIKFHGNVFEGIKDTYRLTIKSVGEAFHAINVITKQKLYKQLLENDKKGIKYRLLINGRTYEPDEATQKMELEALKTSELVMKSTTLKTIDVVPVVEGAEDTIAIIAGVLLIVVGIIVSPFVGPLGAALIIAGIGLIAAGVINLLSKPPQFEDFREISGGGKMSYLFNGPQNTTREGGPVPVGYGRLIVGSHVIAASYEISHQSAATILTS